MARLGEAGTDVLGDSGPGKDEYGRASIGEAWQASTGLSAIGESGLCGDRRGRNGMARASRSRLGKAAPDKNGTSWQGEAQHR